MLDVNQWEPGLRQKEKIKVKELRRLHRKEDKTVLRLEISMKKSESELRQLMSDPHKSKLRNDLVILKESLETNILFIESIREGLVDER